jgi:hypothetical protein
MTEANFAPQMKEERQMFSLESDEGVCPLPIPREKRARDLAERQAHEKFAQEHLERIADLIAESMMQFLAETPGRPVIDLTLSSAAAPTAIRLRIDGSGKITDVTDELPI